MQRTQPLTILKCSVELDFQFNVTFHSCMNRNPYALDFQKLALFKKLDIFKALTPKNTSISISPDLLFLCLLFFSMLADLFLKNMNKTKSRYLLKIFVFKKSYVISVFLRRMCAKVKPCNQIQFFTPEYTRACNALDKICFNYQVNFLQSQT